MADDQNQGPKTMSIDDLVNELTKKNPSPVPKPPVSPTTNPPQPMPTVPPPTPPSASSGPAIKPQAPASVPPKTPPPAPKIQEYQSSIRTMKEDIANVQKGQHPAGLSVPRKIEPSAPVPIAPKPNIQQPPKPSAPQFKIPQVSLGETQKAAPLPQTKPITPPQSAPAPVKPSPVPSVPAPVPRPAMPSAPQVQQKQQIYVPPSSGEAVSSNNRLFLIIAGLVVVFGFLYWFLALRSTEPEIVIETPTPTVEATPVPVLNELFTGFVSNVTLEGDDLVKSLKSKYDTINADGGKFTKLTLAGSDGGVLSWLNLITPPQQVIDSLASDLLLLDYGQVEKFNQTGQLQPSAPVEDRLVIVAEVKDASFATQGLSGWENTMTADLQNIFDLKTVKQTELGFLTSNYKGVEVRYKNFPWPDRSIDHAVFQAVNGKYYMVLANSRESMFSAIDILKGAATISPIP